MSTKEKFQALNKKYERKSLKYSFSSPQLVDTLPRFTREIHLQYLSNLLFLNLTQYQSSLKQIPEDRVVAPIIIQLKDENFNNMLVNNIKEIFFTFGTDESCITFSNIDNFFTNYEDYYNYFLHVGFCNIFCGFSTDEYNELAEQFLISYYPADRNHVHSLGLFSSFLYQCIPFQQSFHDAFLSRILQRTFCSDHADARELIKVVKESFQHSISTFSVHHLNVLQFLFDKNKQQFRKVILEGLIIPIIQLWMFSPHLSSNIIISHPFPKAPEASSSRKKTNFYQYNEITYLSLLIEGLIKMTEEEFNDLFVEPLLKEIQKTESKRYVTFSRHLYLGEMQTLLTNSDIFIINELSKTHNKLKDVPLLMQEPKLREFNDSMVAYCFHMPNQTFLLPEVKKQNNLYENVELNRKWEKIRFESLRIGIDPISTLKNEKDEKLIEYAYEYEIEELRIVKRIQNYICDNMNVITKIKENINEIKRVQEMNCLQVALHFPVKFEMRKKKTVWESFAIHFNNLIVDYITRVGLTILQNKIFPINQKHSNDIKIPEIEFKKQILEAASKKNVIDLFISIVNDFLNKFNVKLNKKEIESIKVTFERIQIFGQGYVLYTATVIPYNSKINQSIPEVKYDPKLNLDEFKEALIIPLRLIMWACDKMQLVKEKNLYLGQYLLSFVLISNIIEKIAETLELRPKDILAAILHKLELKKNEVSNIFYLLVERAKKFISEYGGLLGIPKTITIPIDKLYNCFQ